MIFLPTGDAPNEKDFCDLHERYDSNGDCPECAAMNLPSPQPESLSMNEPNSPTPTGTVEEEDDIPIDFTQVFDDTEPGFTRIEAYRDENGRLREELDALKAHVSAAVQEAVTKYE